MGDLHELQARLAAAFAQRDKCRDAYVTASEGCLALLTELMLRQVDVAWQRVGAAIVCCSSMAQMRIRQRNLGRM